MPGGRAAIEGRIAPMPMKAWQTSAKAGGNCCKAPRGRKDEADQAGTACTLVAPHWRCLGGLRRRFGPNGPPRLRLNAASRGGLRYRRPAGFQRGQRSATVALFCSHRPGDAVDVSASARAKLTRQPRPLRDSKLFAASTFFSPSDPGAPDRHLRPQPPAEIR